MISITQEPSDIDLNILDPFLAIFVKRLIVNSIWLTTEA